MRDDHGWLAAIAILAFAAVLVGVAYQGGVARGSRAGYVACRDSVIAERRREAAARETTRDTPADRVGRGRP